MSVDFPAPFSPISACTSPGRRSMLTSSLATTPGNFFVMWSSTTRGGAERPASSCSVAVVGTTRSLDVLRTLRNHDVAAEDLLRVPIDDVDNLGGERLGVRLGVPHALIGQAEDLEAGDEVTLSGLLDRVVHGGVDALEHRGEDQRLLLRSGRQVLVGVDADRELVGLYRGPEQAGPRQSGGVVDDLRALVVHLRRQGLPLDVVHER